MAHTGKIRLHKYVSDALKQSGDYTHPEIQHNIEEYGVLVDESLIKNRLVWVFPGQVVEPHNWPQRPKGNFSEIQFLRETDEYAVIFKPYNVVVEPGAGHQNNNLLVWLKANRPNESYHLVHRLDKDTQGVMILAKTVEDKDFFQNQFRDREITKKYIAVVQGKVEQTYHADNYQSRDHLHPTRQLLFWDEKTAMDYDKLSRRAESIIRPLMVCEDLNQSIVEVQIKTGRMHQIRLVCESLGFALVADKVYHKTVLPTFVSAQNLHTYFTNVVRYLGSGDFSKKKVELFGENPFCLLSNYLKIQVKSGEWLEVVWKENV